MLAPSPPHPSTLRPIHTADPRAQPPISRTQLHSPPAHPALHLCAGRHTYVRHERQEVHIRKAGYAHALGRAG
eukprot:352821-Chlamydomonas_euryale.AAC.15